MKGGKKVKKLIVIDRDGEQHSVTPKQFNEWRLKAELKVKKLVYE